MAVITKQANFRLSNNHVNIITSLSASEHVTKAAVVEHALELLEAHVDAGGHIRASRGGGPTKQANFRLSVRHVAIIDRLAAREHVTKATVVERALEQAREEVANGGSISSGGHRAVRDTFAPAAVDGSAALKVAEPEETPVLPYVANEAPAPVAATESVRIAAQVAEPEPVPEATPAVQQSAPKPAPAAEPEAKDEPKPQPKHEQKAEAKPEPAEAVAPERAESGNKPKRKAARFRKPAEESVRVQEPMPQTMPEPVAQPYPYVYPMPAAAPQYIAPAASYGAPAYGMPAQAAPTQMPASALAAKDSEISKADMKAAVLEERLSGQIEALKESLEAKDARIDALLKELDARKQDGKDARMESLIAQIAENSGKPAPVAQPEPAPVPAPQPAPAPQQQNDPRIDMILQRLDSQKQQDPRLDAILSQLQSQKQDDPRIDAILRQLDSQKQDDQSARLEALIRELAAKSNQPAAPAPAVTPSRNDDIIQIINALKPAQQAADSGYQIEAARSAAREEGKRAGIEEGRNAGREEGRREAEAEVNRRLDDLRREYERKIEAARAEGYEAGKKEISADTEKLLAEARTSGAFYERAKIANMRGLVFGEKRRYLKVHVTM